MRQSTQVQVLFLLTVVSIAVVSAQTFGGGIGGTVTDPSGKSIAGAAITIEQVSTGLKLNLASTSTGLYTAHGLPVGKYSVYVNARGFATTKRENIEVQEGSERVVDVQLSIGESSQTVTVMSEGAEFDSASSEVSAVNSGHVVRELPLNGRDWTTLASLQPEVAIVRTENTVTLGNGRGNRGLGLMMAIGREAGTD